MSYFYSSTASSGNFFSTYTDEEAIESDSEGDESVTKVAEDEDEWVDEDNDDNTSFQRVESIPYLTSRNSLLTLALHEGDLAMPLRNAASRSTPAVHRSRTRIPSDPSTGDSPQKDSGFMMCQRSRPKPIIIKTSSVCTPRSPRSVRREVLLEELSTSLRNGILRERRQKNATYNAAAKQRGAVSIPTVRRAVATNNIGGINVIPRSAAVHDNANNKNSFDKYFGQGIPDYHERGW